jgi:hypothetical protein
MSRRARLLRILHLAHRWLGIGLAAVVLVWTISGLVMLFAERPGLTEEERLEALATLEVAQVRVTPAAAWRQVGANGWPEAVRLNTAFDGRPAYRFLAGGAWYSVHADDASVVPAIGEAQAVSAAAALPGAADAAWQVVGQLAQDYWTRSPRFNSQRPFLLLEDGSGRQAYVARDSGEIVFESTRWQRLFDRIGTSAHWLWLFSADIDREVRRAVMLTLGFAALAMTVSGLWVGIQRLRLRHRYPGGRRSPYREGWKRWHHVLGLASGVFLLGWLASGWLSYSPFGLLPGSFVSGTDRQWLAGGRIDAATLAAFTVAAADLRARESLREVEWTHFSGAPLLQVRSFGQAGGVTRLLAGTPTVGEIALTRNGRLTVEAIAARVAGLLPSARLIEAEEIGNHDAEYLPHQHRRRPLPVVRLRFDDPARTVYYVDPATSHIEARIDASARLRRWGFAALHRLDFPPLGESFAMRASLVTVALLAAIALGVGGFVLGWRRLGRFC